jgi:Domain of unknown function (DUF1707)
MAGPRGERAAGTAGQGHLRASRADREPVIATLKAAFVQGRLDKDEFDLRVSQTFASRTYAELAVVTADLPAGLTAAKPPAAAQAPCGRPAAPLGRVIRATATLYAAAWAYVLLVTTHQGENPWARPLIIDVTAVCLGVVIICVTAALASRPPRRSGAPPPQRPDAGGPASTHTAGRAA